MMAAGPAMGSPGVAVNGGSKSEIRSTKSETNPNQAEPSKFQTEGPAVSIIASYVLFEFVSDFGFRVSDSVLRGDKKTAGPSGPAVHGSAPYASVEEAFQLATADRVLELAHRLGL